VKDDRGQAAVELALSLPVVVLLLLLVVQTGLVLRDQVLVVHAAREAARAAAVETAKPPAPEVAARRAAVSSTGLEMARLKLDVTAQNGRYHATIRYRSPIVVPLVDVLVRDVPLVGNAALTRENN
jgi:Flp pilus assembly protein TadG